MSKTFVTDEKRGDGGAVMNWYGASMPGIARRSHCRLSQAVPSFAGR